MLKKAALLFLFFLNTSSFIFCQKSNAINTQNVDTVYTKRMYKKIVGMANKVAMDTITKYSKELFNFTKTRVGSSDLKSNKIYKNSYKLSLSILSSLGDSIPYYGKILRETVKDSSYIGISYIQESRYYFKNQKFFNSIESVNKAYDILIKVDTSAAIQAKSILGSYYSEMELYDMAIKCDSIALDLVKRKKHRTIIFNTF